MSQLFFPGHDTWYASDSPNTEFTAIFEDDGEAGYLYAHNRAENSRVVEAVQIYNVSSVVDKEWESECKILWSTDGMKALLLINDFPQAMLDFAEQCSYGRRGVQPQPGEWHRSTWNENLLKLFQTP